MYHPKHMTVEKLQELYEYAWDTFYEHETQNQKMFKLIMKIINKEIKNGTYRPRKKDISEKSFGKDVDR